MLRKIAVFLLLIFSIQIVSSIPASASETFRDLVARAGILAEKDSGTILFENNIHTRHPADSLTLIMTLFLASLAVENDDVNDHEIITMTENAWNGLNDNNSTLDIDPGDTMTFIDLMYSAYVGNASEAANMIALRLGGTITSFVAQMNAKAVELGANNTKFTNPHGGHSESQYTTAFDIYLIFSEAMRNALFAEVASTFRHITEAVDETPSRILTTSNAFMNQSSRYYYRHCISGRDSATFEGGYSLVAFAEEDGLALISVVLGSSVLIHDDDSTDIRNFSESLRLFQWGYNNFAWRDVLKTTDLLARVPILHGSGVDFVNARPATSLSLLLNNSVPTNVFIRNIRIFSEENDDPLVAPIDAGAVLGEVVITRDGVEYARMDLVANTNVSLSGIEYIRGQVRELLSTTMARTIMLILGGLLIIYVLLVVRYNIVRANRLRKIKEAKNDLIRERHQNFRD